MPKKSVEVILANPPWKKGDNWGVRAGSRWPHIKNRGEEAYLPFPFFLAYAAALLSQRGINVRLVDALAEKIENDSFIGLVNELKPKLLVAEVSTPSLENDLLLLKNINRADTKIAVCGLDFNIRQPKFLQENDFIDYVMFGEYEYTALDLFEHLDSREFKGIPGLIYRDNGRVRVNPDRPLINDLDQLPWPMREGLSMDKYIDAPGDLKTPSVQMLASRGCPFGCIFCTWPQLIYNSNRCRMRNPKKIVEEMEYLVKKDKFKSVYFDDDTFNISKTHILRICREIKDRALSVPWAAMARADLMDEELLHKMKEAGLYSVKYGVESSNQEALDKVGKQMDLKKAERMIRFTKSLGIKIHLSFAFGMPGETAETIDATIDYAIGLTPDTVQFSLLTPYPGTEYYRRLDAQGDIVSRDWSDYNASSKSVIKTEHLTPAGLEDAKERALEAWRRYRRSKKSFVAMPFDKELQMAFKNNLKKNGTWQTLAKTARYIVNV